MNRRETCSQGYSLVEVLVVLVFFGMLMLVGLPSLLDLIHRSKLEGAAQQTASIMRRARLEAIQRNLPAMVLVRPSENRVLAFLDDGATGGAFDSDDTVLGEVPLPRGVEVRDETGNVGSAADTFGDPDGPVFLGDGSAAASGAVRLADVRNNVLQVEVAPAATGKVNVAKWQGGKWIEPGGDGPWEWQ